MADKRKAKSTKPTGQRKSAAQVNDSDVLADKENSQTTRNLNAVTSSERPRPRPIKKSTVPEHAERSESIQSFGGESNGLRDSDEGAAMAVEAQIIPGYQSVSKHAFFLGVLVCSRTVDRQNVPVCDAAIRSVVWCASCSQYI